MQKTGGMMEGQVAYDRLEDALAQCGASWDAAQAHGLLTGRLVVAGPAAGGEWLGRVLEDVESNSAVFREIQDMLSHLAAVTAAQLQERLSAFAPLLPDDGDDIALRTRALAHWCEGFLHGLVSGEHGDALKARLAEEPVADIVKDMLQITRAGLDEDADDEGNEADIAELVEYLRVAAQLCYEELADLRGREPGT